MRSLRLRRWAFAVGLSACPPARLPAGTEFRMSEKEVEAAEAEAAWSSDGSRTRTKTEGGNGTEKGTDNSRVTLYSCSSDILSSLCYSINVPLSTSAPLTENYNPLT